MATQNPQETGSGRVEAPLSPAHRRELDRAALACAAIASLLTSALIGYTIGRSESTQPSSTPAEIDALYDISCGPNEVVQGVWAQVYERKPIDNRLIASGFVTDRTEGQTVKATVHDVPLGSVIKFTVGCGFESTEEGGWTRSLVVPPDVVTANKTSINCAELTDHDNKTCSIEPA